jgi:hypothetical protein
MLAQGERNGWQQRIQKNSVCFARIALVSHRLWGGLNFEVDVDVEKRGLFLRADDASQTRVKQHVILADRFDCCTFHLKCVPMHATAHLAIVHETCSDKLQTPFHQLRQNTVVQAIPIKESVRTWALEGRLGVKIHVVVFHGDI